MNRVSDYTNGISILPLVIMAIVLIAVGLIMMGCGMVTGILISLLGLVFAPAIVYNVLSGNKNMTKSK